MHQSKWEFYWLRNTYEGASVQVTLWGQDNHGGAGSRLSLLDVQHLPLGVTRPHTALAWSWVGIRGVPEHPALPWRRKTHWHQPSPGSYGSSAIPQHSDQTRVHIAQLTFLSRQLTANLGRQGVGPFELGIFCDAVIQKIWKQCPERPDLTNTAWTKSQTGNWTASNCSGVLSHTAHTALHTRGACDKLPVNFNIQIFLMLKRLLKTFPLLKKSQSYICLNMK